MKKIDRCNVYLGKHIVFICFNSCGIFIENDIFLMNESNNDNILYQGRNTQFYVHILVVCLKNEVIKNWAQQMLSLERVHLIV